MYKENRRGNRRQVNSIKKLEEVKDLKKKKREGFMKKCNSCDSEMKPRGASNCSGGLSWKCRNKKCGRTLWIQKSPTTPPIPLTPVFFKVGW